MKIARFNSSRRGYTLVEIMIVVAILGLLVALAIPNFLKSRNNAQKQVCIENLAQIESAKQIWGVEAGHKEGDVPNDGNLFGATLYMKVKPKCPGGGQYTLNAIGVNATCENDGHVL